MGITLSHDRAFCLVKFRVASVSVATKKGKMKLKIEIWGHSTGPRLPH